MSKVLLLQGPNLNLLGTRERSLYGQETLDSLVKRVRRVLASAKIELNDFQHNAEHELIERIHQAKSDDIAYIIFNPAAFTHTSIALRDALLAVEIPFIELHLSNVYQRESFRHHSYFSDIAAGIIVGLGPLGYDLAAHAVIQKLNTKS